MLISINLNNWKSHKQTFLKLKKGTNLFIGDMGTGKSSVLDAISYSLFGTFPNLDRKRVTLGDLFHLNENDISLELIFAFNDKTYKVERTLKRKIGKKTSISTDAKLYENEKLIEKGQRVVSERIEHILNTDYSLFTRAIYSEQNNIDYFIGLNPSRRKVEIDRLLGMDKFEKARANITTIINTTRIKRKAISESQDINMGPKLKSDLEKLEEENKKQTEVLQTIQIEQKRYSEEINRIGEEYKKISALRTEFNNTKKREERLLGEIKTIKNELERTPQDTNMTDQIKKLESEIDTINKDLTNIRKQLTEYRNTKSELYKKMGYYNSNISRIESDLKHIEELTTEFNTLSEGASPEAIEKRNQNLVEESNNLMSKIRYLIAKTDEEKKHLNALKPGLSKCPVCGTQLSDEKIKSIITEKKSEILKILNDRDVSTKKLNDTKSQIESLRLKTNKLNNILQNLKAYKQRSSESKKEEYEKDAQEIRGNLKLIDEKISNIEKINNKHLENKRLLSLKRENLIRLARLKNTLKEKTNELNLIEDKLKQIDYTESKFKQVENTWVDIRTKYETINQRTQLKKRELEVLKHNIDMIQKQISNIAQLEKKIKKLIKLEEELLYFKDIIIEVQVSLRSELMESINRTIAELWTLFYPYQNYDGIRITPTEKDYIFEIKYNGEWKPLETIASGGERACTALSFRVALAIVMTPSLSWFILDEPTHNLDRSAVNLLSNALQYKIPELVDQTIVITHDEDLIGDNFGATYRFSRDKSIGTSPTKIEEI